MNFRDFIKFLADGTFPKRYILVGGPGLRL